MDGTEAPGRALTLPEPYEKFAERPVVTGDVLVVGLVPADREDHVGPRIGGFSLSSGEPLWEWQGKGSTYADGRVVAHRRLPGSAFEPRFAVSGDVIAVACSARGDTRRLRVFRWR